MFASHAMVNREKARIILPQTPPEGPITFFSSAGISWLDMLVSESSETS